jgi:transcriptional regulator with XRE-family HTH domain
VTKNEKCNGRLIEHYRQLRKLTQMQLAVRAGLSERLIRKAENGQPLPEHRARTGQARLFPGENDRLSGGQILERGRNLRRGNLCRRGW